MKIGFFITARLKSSRLKNKILLDLNGKTVLDRVIERCKATAGVDGVVLCTSTNSQDAVLYQKALDHKIQFYPGSEDDVLDRLLSAAEYFGYDAFVSITADNPLFPIYLSQLLIDNYKKNKPDFTFIKNVPIGFAPYFLDTKALKVAHFMKKESDTEIWGPFINRSDFFNITEILVKNSPFKEDKRLTCDYIEDYRLIQNIYRHVDSDMPNMFDVFQLLKEKPELWKINECHKQQQLSVDVIYKINTTFDSMTEKGKKIALENDKILKPELNKIEINI